MTDEMMADMLAFAEGFALVFLIGALIYSLVAAWNRVTTAKKVAAYTKAFDRNLAAYSAEYAAYMAAYNKQLAASDPSPAENHRR